MAVKKRTLGDDLRDFKAGKAPDGYRDNIKNTTPYAIKSWQHSDGFVGGEGSADNPIYGDNKPEITEMQVNYETKHRYENDGKKIAAIVPKAKKNYDVPTREQFLEYIKKVGTTDTVPSKEQMTQYKAESDMYRDMDMGSKYGNATYEELKKGYKTATDGREKEWLLNRIKESASSKQLEDWKKDLEDTYNSDIESIKNDGTKDKGVQYSQRKKAFDDDTSEIESLIEEKRRQETSQKNQKKDELYSDKYKDYDYKKLKTESSNNKLPDEEREWLKNSADEKATSKDLQGELDSLEAEYKELLKSSEEDHTTFERKTITDRLDFIEKRRPKLQNLIEKKIQEENEKKYYYDIVENDVKAATVIQKYYKLNKFNKNGTSYKSANADEAVKYPEMGEKSQDERTKIEQDFYNLEKKGYDTEKLLKYYSRIKEREEAEENLEYLRNQADKYPISSSFGSMIMNTYGSIPDTVNYIGAGIDKAFGGDGYINPDSTNVAKAQIMREKVSEDMDGLGKFFYNTGMSIGDNLARMPLLALPGGEAMSLALAGTSAGVSSANDVINSGGSLESALWTGAAAGTAEVVFEKISLDKLIDLRKKGTDSVFRAVVNQMKTEGLEEVGTDIANAITDQIINGDMSQLALQYQNYIAQGYSEDEAWKMTAGYFASQLGQSFAAGAISGGVLSGGTVAINKIGGTIEEKSEKRQSVSQLGREALQSEDFNVNELIKTAKKSDNPKAVNLANSLEKVVEEKGADKVKAVDVGNLLTLTNSEEITYDYLEDLSELTGTDKQNIIDSNFELNGEEKTSKTSDGEVKYTDTKAFGENYPHGLGAKISKTGERITIVGIKSSSKDFNSDDNTVVLLADNGELYDSDDIRTSVSHFNDLFDYAKNFDTIGARVYLSQYEDYAKRSKSRGKTADIAEYSECFERLYSYGIKGVTYDSIKKSGNFTREINILSAGVAYSAVQSGNNDFKVDTRDKSNKSQKIRMPGESNSISSKVYVDPGSEDSVKVTDEQLAILQAVADKTGREIVLTDRMGERTGDENANGGYNLNDGKIYINAEVHDSYMLSVSLHEAVHGVASDNPAEYHALCTFITNYLVAKGENIDNLLDDIKIKWGDSVRSEDAALEELVCQTVMAIATDEAAIKTALSLEENKGILKKVASALKKIAKAAYDFIKGVGVQAHNKQAQPWIDDINAINELATRLEKAFESTRKLNEQRANAAENTETAQKNNTQSDVKFSYGGPTAKTANISLLDQAIDMENSGKDSESNRKRTGWFRGMEGMWRFEIDDNKMRFYKATKQDIKNIEEYKNNKIRYNGLSHKIANNTATAEQQQRFKEAEEYIKEYETSKKLSDYVSHPELFRAYPQLKEVNFYFDTISAKGAYYPDGNAIVINPTLSQDEQRESVIHEIQHAIQHIEGFADGSTMAQWQKNGADSLTAYNNYRNTAGEIEARDTANRVNLNSEQRKNTRPDIDRKDVVFAENAKISMDDIKNYELDTYSEREIKNWNSNKNIVIYRNNEQLIRFIDNALNNPTEFKKLYFGKISKNLARFIKKETNIDLTGYNLSLRSYEIRKTLINSHGNEEKENLRGQRAITKEDLIHLPEIITHPDKIELSEKLYENKPVIIFSKTINGKISTATYVSSKHHDLSLQTMYSGKNKESLATTPSGNHSFSQTSETLSGTAFNKSLLQNNNNVKHSVDDVIDENSRAEVTQKAINTEYVDVNGKQHSDLRFAVDDTIDNEYLEAVKNNDLETAQKFVDEAAKKNGYTIKAYHGTTNQQEKSTWNDKMKWYDTEYKHFTVFKRQYDEQAGHFFNDDIDNAGGYGSILYSVYLKINKPLVIDCKGQNYASITFDGKEMDTYEWAEYAKKHRYDGVIFKNISDGVGYDDLSRLTTDYVVFESNQIKSSEPITYDDKGNVIPLSKRFNYLVDIRYSKDDTIDSNDKKITAGMSDSERAEILNNKSIEKVTFDYDKAKDFDLDYIENNIKSIVEKPLLEKLGKLGAFKNYKANNIDIDFSFTRNGMKKSLHSQEIYYGGSKSDLVKIILSLDELLDKAVLIESHFDKAKGTPKENKRLKQVFVLLNVLEDENNTIPVQFEIKQFIDNNNRLYLAVALTSFKTEEEISVKANTAQEKNQVRTKLGLSPEISIPELISKINIRDRNFLKYIPNVLLTKEQINAKNLAIEEENKKYGRTDYYDEDFSDISEIKLAVDDTISDGMFADGDLFDEDGYIQQSVFERAVKDNPDFALTAVYNHAAKTAETAIKQSRDVKLTYEAYMKIARRLMSRYDISRKLNKDFDEELAQIIKKHTRRMEKGVADFAGELELLVDDCKDALMLSGKLDGEAFKTEREEILSYLRGKTLILTEYAESDVRGDYDTLQNYRKRMFGKINVAYEKNLKNNSKGLFWDLGNNIYINDVIAFVEEHFPHLITDDADDISGYRWLDNLVNNVLKPKFVNNYIDGFYENIDTAAIEMAFDVTTEIINAKAKYAAADSKTERKYIRKIAKAKEQAAAEQRAIAKAKVESYSDKAKTERSKRIKMIENLRRRMSENTDKSDKQRLKYEAQIDKLKTSLDEKTIILNMGYETIRDQYNENRTKTVYREKLGRMLDRMTKKLDGKATNNEYIPEVLKKPILDVLSSFTADPGTYKNGKKKALPGYYGEWKNIAKIGDRVNELTIAYGSLKPDKTESDDYSNSKGKKGRKYSFIDIDSISFRDSTLKVLEYLSENLKGKNIYDLSADDLIDIYEAMQELDNSLRSAVEIILDGQKMSVQEAANRAIAETESVKYKKDVQRFNNTTVNVVAGIPREIKNKFLATQLDPVRQGRRLSGYHDDYVISQVMRELHEGDKKRTRIMQECFVRVQAVTSSYSKSEIKGLQRNDVTEFNFKEQKTGKRVRVSQGMLLAIYLTDRQADGHRHLVNENFNHYTVIPDLDMMNLGRDGMNKSHRVRFSEADLRAIKQYVESNKMLSELAGAISEVYNTILNQYINEVSMAKYGKLIATVKNYYPLKVYKDGAHYEKNFEAEFYDRRLKNRGFTKQRTNSEDKIVINDVLKTFTNSVQSVSEYCGLLIPIENFKRVYNSGNGDVTLHEAIKEKFGESAEHYIEKLMADLQNAPEILDNTWFQKAQGNYMGAKLLANPGAAIKQLAAFPTAFNYFGVKNVTAAAAVGMAKIDFDLYAKYTPYLWYRKNGNGTVIGELSREIGFYKKSMDRIDIMGKMDRYVVGCLLYAAELHVEQTTDLKRGTDAFYKEVVRQFEKCVDETQPNNMITSKPQFIRNNVMKLLSLNAFKSQNMAIANCIIDSYGEFAARKAEYKESKTDEAKAAKNEAAKKFAGSVIGAVCSSVLIGVLTVAVNLFIWHKWDDFKDEEGNVTPLTILLNFIDYSLESFAGCFIWADKAYDAISAKIKGEKYWGLEVMSIENLNDAVEKLTKGDFVGFATIIVDCLGFPLENLLRIARSISSYANDIWNGNGEIITENNSLQWENNTSYFNFIIVEAKQKGETEKAEHFEQMWKDDLINKQGKTEKQANDTIKKKLVTALAVSDDDVEQAALAKANGDLKSYEEHMNKVVGYGFDSVDVKKAVDKVIKNVSDDVKNRGLEEKSDIISDLKNQGFNEKGAEYVYKSMQSGESTESEEEMSAFSDTSEGEGVAYTYSDAFEYLKNGDMENYERIEQYLIDNSDKTKKDVQSAMRSASRTDELWKEYFEAQGTLSGGGDPVKLEELKMILTNIYGSWSTAATYGRKYQKRMKKKEREKNK